MKPLSKRGSALKRGDPVMVISGGNQKSGRVLRGKTGIIREFVDSQRAIVEGLNMVTRHIRARRPNEKSGKMLKEAPIHVSRLMYYVEKLNRPVKLRYTRRSDGVKVRGYRDPHSKEFVQLAK